MATSCPEETQAEVSDEEFKTAAYNLLPADSE
jgi:hypothetical protein